MHEIILVDFKFGWYIFRVVLNNFNESYYVKYLHLINGIHVSQELDDNLAELTAEFERATAAKLKCQQEAEATANTISLANRLVGGLASEKVRWAESVKKFKEDEKTLGTLL